MKVHSYPGPKSRCKLKLIHRIHSFMHLLTNSFIHLFINDTMEYIILLCSIVIIGDIILLSTYYVLSALLKCF